MCECVCGYMCTVHTQRTFWRTHTYIEYTSDVLDNLVLYQNESNISYYTHLWQFLFAVFLSLYFIIGCSCVLKTNQKHYDQITIHPNPQSFSMCTNHSANVKPYAHIHMRSLTLCNKIITMFYLNGVCVCATISRNSLSTDAKLIRSITRADIHFSIRWCFI